MRLRVTFSKEGALRYIGHLDLQQIWERTVRRAGLALVYSQGFHPSPKIQIASALPLGFLGRAEVVDLWLKEEVENISLPDLQARLQKSAPPGLILHKVEQVDERAPALQTQVLAAEYQVTLLDDPSPDLDVQIAALLARPSLPRQRRGREYDLRPLILSLESIDRRTLRMVLSAREGATGRPEEVLAELGIPFEATRIERTRLIFKEDI